MHQAYFVSNLLPRQQLLHALKHVVWIIDELDYQSTTESSSGSRLSTFMTGGEKADSASAEHSIPYGLLEDAISDLVVVHRALHDRQEAFIELCFIFIKYISSCTKIHQRKEECYSSQHYPYNKTEERRLRAKTGNDTAKECRKQGGKNDRNNGHGNIRSQREKRVFFHIRGASRYSI